MRKIISLIIAIIPLVVFAQPLRQKSMKRWGVTPANYSGITPLGNNRYAVVSDKEAADGFYIMQILQDPKTGKVKEVIPEGFYSNPTPTTDKNNWTIRDCEGITYFPAANTVFISGEGDQQILEYSLNGVPTGRKLNIPAEFATANIYHNLGFEALTYCPSSHRFWTITEGPLRADGTPNSPQQTEQQNLLRLQCFGDDLQPLAQYAYRMDFAKNTKVGSSHSHGVPELCALPDGRLLVLEREIRVSPNYLSSHVECKLFLINPLESHQIDSYTKFDRLDPNHFMIKKLVANFKTRLNAVQYSIANYEGMCLGIRLNDGTQTLLLVNDSQGGWGKGLIKLKDYIKVVKL